MRVCCGVPWWRRVGSTDNLTETSPLPETTTAPAEPQPHAQADTPAPDTAPSPDRAEAAPSQGRLECQPSVTPGHPDPARSDRAHPALMSGEGTDPIRLNGRMMACTLPMMFPPGTVPWNSSPMW